MGVTVVVDNVTGGSGARAMATLAKARPDGGTFYATTPTFIYTSLMSKVPASYRDLEPLVNVFYDPEVLYTAADSRFQTLRDAVAAARVGQEPLGSSQPGVARAPDARAGEAARRRRADHRHVRRRRRPADQRSQPHTRHRHRRAAGAARADRRAQGAPAGRGRRCAAAAASQTSRRREEQGVDVVGAQVPRSGRAPKARRLPCRGGMGCGDPEAAGGPGLQADLHAQRAAARVRRPR